MGSAEPFFYVLTFPLPPLLLAEERYEERDAQVDEQSVEDGCRNHFLAGAAGESHACISCGGARQIVLPVRRARPETSVEKEREGADGTVEPMHMYQEISVRESAVSCAVLYGGCAVGLFHCLICFGTAKIYLLCIFAK